MKIYSKAEIKVNLPYSELIDALNDGFKTGGNAPLRHYHPVETETGTENSFLIMPCWQEGAMMGVKLVMVCPDNHKKSLESVQSTYILSDATTGMTKAILDGDELTVRRTSCASALASKYLSSPEANCMLMMGAGKLAAHLIHAHATVRNLTEIYVWARRYEQAQEFAAHHDLNVIAVKDPAEYAEKADIISCATLAKQPILKGAWLDPNKKQHIDLVGGYTKDMREADNDVVSMASIYIDTDGALAEAGDILRPIDEGIITHNDIKGDLFDMVKTGFEIPNGTTMFKSVGTALEDLIAAKVVYEKTSI
ncbi:MAG: ornithine cyclodeaminase family protein [Emcibacteraceae bacterium]|nr:ornithine cyclodeaminase family protein [Emcibacteraceae bacterium]MDG1997051.1 ornithine cyclodeaminase family protein [Emcibacteraceae bacterium]